MTAPLIIPAILESNKVNFQKKIEIITSISRVQRIQVDFTETDFVGTSTLSIEQIDQLDPRFYWEAHLMIRSPGKFELYKKAGFKTIIVHYEAYKNYTDLDAGLRELKRLELDPVIAINPNSSVELLVDYQTKVKQFTVLGVEPGKQGQQMNSDALIKLKKLKEMCPGVILELDGGVKTSLVSQAHSAGADFLVVGSSLFETNNIQAQFDLLVNNLQSDS